MQPEAKTIQTQCAAPHSSGVLVTARTHLLELSPSSTSQKAPKATPVALHRL